MCEHVKECELAYECVSQHNVSVLVRTKKTGSAGD